MKKRYISFKLTDSLLQKLARYYYGDIEQINVLADLHYSICERKDEPANNVSDCFAVGQLAENCDFDEDFFSDLEHFKLLENLSTFNVLEKKCLFLDLILTTTAHWKARIERTLIAFEQENFQVIAELLHKSLTWDEFSTLPVTFLHLSKKFQPRMFATHQLVCIILERDPTNLFKLPEVRECNIKRYYERESNKFSGIFVYAGEKPLLLEVLSEQLVHPDEITFLGNAKPPISVKMKQFKPMKDVIEFELPEIQHPEIIKDVKIDIEVKFQLYLDAEQDIKAEYEYVAFSQKILMTYYDDFRNAVNLKNPETHASTELKFIGFKLSDTENVIVFDRNLINQYKTKLSELFTFALYFNPISEKVFVPHIMQFKPKPEPDWFDKEFQSESSELIKILILPDAGEIRDFFDFRMNKWNHRTGKLSRTLKNINLLTLDESWQSVKNLIYFLNPKLGKIIAYQQNSGFDRIKHS